MCEPYTTKAGHIEKEVNVSHLLIRDPSRPSRLLNRLVFRIRWGTLAVLLLIALAMPRGDDTGIPTWVLVLSFSIYTGIIDLLHSYRLQSHVPLWLVSLDLVLVSLVYLLGADAGGPLFVLFGLAIISAAAHLPLRGALLYTSAAAATAALIDLSFLMLAIGIIDGHMIMIRLLLLLLLSAGMAIVMQRLILEQGITSMFYGDMHRSRILDELHAQFIATISHDLRTPLTAAHAGLGMLNESIHGRLQPAEDELLSTIRRNMDRLNLLIDDLLAFNQIEAGALRLEYEQLNLRTVIHNAALVIQPLLLEKGQTLAIDLPFPLPCAGDARRLEQVLVNLFSNAHYHTPVGTHIVVAGECTEQGIQVTVYDNGPGIPSDQLEAIFQRFYRLASSSNGSGLGLAIAKRVVELHGGHMWAESSPGSGVALHLRLPQLSEASIL
jgi:signal transduction histidine kinase